MVMVEEDFGPEDYEHLPEPHLRAVPDGELSPEPHLMTNTKGKPLKTAANVIDMLSMHPDWKGVLVWDEFAQTVRKRKPPPVREQDVSARVCVGEWTDADTTRTQAWLQSQPLYHRIDAHPGIIEAAVVAVAERHSTHPVREWLQSLEWDGTQRLHELFVVHFGALDTPLNRAVGERWMISAVARVMKPGCQCKYMPVLESPQDAGKSSGIAALVGESPDGVSWYSETPLRIGDKDSYQCLRGKWVHEWGELAAFKSSKDVENLKSFISSRSDNFRQSYGKRSQDYARQCVFIGTTNEDRWLTDPTGGSRFWPIRAREDTLVDTAAIADLREQFWAEAVVRFEGGERWWIDPTTEPDLLQSARVEQKERTEEDPWLELVRKWLDEGPTVPEDDGSRYRPAVSDGLTVTEILMGACGVRRADLTRSMSTKMGYLMRDLKWRRDRVARGDSRVWVWLPPIDDSDW